MVAVPMLNTALGQRLSIFGGTGVGTKMEASIHLRAKDFAAHERKDNKMSKVGGETSEALSEECVPRLDCVSPEQGG